MISEDLSGEPLSQELLQLKKRVSLSWEALSREFHRVMGEEGPSNTTLFRYATGRVKRKNPMVEQYVRDAIHKVTIDLVQAELNESETQRQRVEHDLAQTEVRFRKMVEHAKDIIFRFRLLPTPGFEYLSPAVFDIAGYNPEEYYADPDGYFTYVSPSITNVLGYSQKEFLTHYVEFLTDDSLADCVRHTQQSARGKQQPSFRVEIFHRDGSVRKLEVTEVTVSDANGEVIAVEGIAHDITGTPG